MFTCQTASYDFTHASAQFALPSATVAAGTYQQFNTKEENPFPETEPEPYYANTVCGMINRHKETA